MHFFFLVLYGLTFVFGAEKNRLSEMVLLSTHNLLVDKEIQF